MHKPITATGACHGAALGAWLGIAVLAGCAAAAATAVDPVEGARMVVRLTARTSLILFVLAFTASSLVRLWPSAGTQWLRENRRYFGLAFAFSHFVHAVALVALSRLDPVLFDTLTTPVSFIAGGIGYAIIIAMAATSLDSTARLVGPRAWRIVHRWGAWFIAVFFVVNFGRRAVVSPEMYWPYMAIILGAITLRVVAARRKPGDEAPAR